MRVIIAHSNTAVLLREVRVSGLGIYEFYVSSVPLLLPFCLRGLFRLFLSIVLLMALYSRDFISVQDEVWYNTSYLEVCSIQSALVLTSVMYVFQLSAFPLPLLVWCFVICCL